MTLARRLDRLAGHWPHPVDVLAAHITEELRAPSPRTLEDSAALYGRCRELKAAAGLSEAATLRALGEALLAVGFPEDGVRKCLADTPDFFILAIACLGVTQMARWHDPPETERQRLDAYLDSLFSDAEREQLDKLAQGVKVTGPG